MTDFTLRPLTVPERKYTYAQSSQLQGQTGNIGYLRGDFGSSGNQFYTTWFDTRPQWKSDEFKRDLDDVINALRSEEYGLLQSRSQMVRYGRENKESEMQGAYTTEFGFRADTEKYAFVLRCNPTRGDYNFYCLCYVKEWLDKHIEEANRDIRFIDSHYKELFRIPDGERIIVTDRDGKTESYPCRYIDSYHTEVGRNLFHICEFAERMEQGGCTYAPMEPPLPPMCYSILPSTGEVIQIDRWQKGYTATSFNDGNRAENEAIKDKFSKTYKFSDINYAVASREDKEAMFLEYSELLNSLDSGATTKITINNRRLNRANFEKTILLPLKGDALDEYREEYNRMLLEKATGANAIIQEKYITISVCKKNVEEARNYFARVGADLIAHFGRLGSKCVELEPDERLRIFHDFYRAGEETEFRFDIKETRRKGHDFKDFICPDSMEFTGDYFKIGERYGRVLFLREYASYIKDSMVAEMTDLNRNLMMSIDVIPVPTDEAVREAESRLLGVETNATNWQRRQNANNNFSAQLPYDIEQQRKEMKEFLDDLTTRDQRMMFAVLTMVHTADTKEQLDNDTEALLTTARKHLCQFGILKFQQLDGLNTAMPFGVRKIESFRTLTTESLAVFIPFRVQDICHTNGVYYGQNVISKNMIIADRRQLLNGNEFILGVSGGGKSFTAKGEVINQVLAGNADIIIIDPEREYSPLVRALGGEIINISATSPTHINAMDMNREYGDGANPVILKSEFIMSLCEQLIGGNNLGAVQKSIIDRCTASVYRTYQQNNYTGEVPTLQDFRAELLKQSEPEAQEIALAIELFTNGSLNTFAKKTNVDTDNRLICYDILDLGKQLMPIGMLVVLDSILNRITQNRAKGKNTFIFIDEIYLLFQHEYSANFLFTLWKRVRKYGAYATGITQNVDDLLQSHTARTMLANSEFIVMLNQASTDRLELAKLLNISDTQLSYITNVDAGHGLIKVGSSLVPFANKFPKHTKLYKLMTTKPGEGA